MNKRGLVWVKGTKSQPGAGVERRREKFKELIHKRVKEAIDAIDWIANLANPKNYKSTEEDWDQVLVTLRKVVDNLEVRVRGPEKVVFKLRERE